MLPTPCGPSSTRTNRLGQTSGPEFSIRPGGLWRMPPAVPVCGSWRGQRPYGDSPPSGSAPATSPGLQKSESFAEYRSRRQVVSIAWLGWFNWESANLATLAGPRPFISYSWQPRWPTCTLVATKTGMMSQGPGSSPNKPENRPDRPAAGACPEFATGSPIVTAQFILVAATGPPESLRPGPVHWLTSASSRHSRAFQPGF